MLLLKNPKRVFLDSSSHSSFLTAFTATPSTQNQKILNVQIEQQKQSNWCWAAVTAAWGNFLQGNHQLTQCSVVDQSFQRNNCCTDGSSENCNQPNELDLAMSAVGIVVTPIPSDVIFETLKEQIDEAKPIGVRVTRNGSGHYMLITGYAIVDGKKMIQVENPNSESKLIAFADFPQSIISDYNWSHTYVSI